ncbi:hypothetical protein BDB00DRAFT_797000 [Zychaea mexicana]|uniref:uncharacterized protein n=1 Tax=Zychaea mexicana TaxID=64656 RepID=UPI0022FF229D|nr:uncharacterized protein BDB00DRAFT_797000 [Zychaea mexicana]KAI9498861.1 hypothetical protein BDB00DRAFT_797000 [Zychaea mexicana]
MPSTTTTIIDPKKTFFCSAIAFLPTFLNCVGYGSLFISKAAESSCGMQLSGMIDMLVVLSSSLSKGKCRVPSGGVEQSVEISYKMHKSRLVSSTSSASCLCQPTVSQSESIVCNLYQLNRGQRKIGLDLHFTQSEKKSKRHGIKSALYDVTLEMCSIMYGKKCICSKQIRTNYVC